MLSLRKTTLALALATALLLPMSALAWIDTGHMVVAAIAAKSLKPAVREQVDALLKLGGDAKTQDFYGASVWADDTKNKQTGTWHYIDYYFRTDGKPAINKPDEENVIWAIDKFSKVLADKSAPAADRADALRYLIHFVGDIHQPLHAVSRESDDMPKGDAGGNRFKIQPVEGINMFRPNLHTLWDFACGLYKPIERPLSPEGKAEVDAVAMKVMADFPKRSLSAADDLKSEDWAGESVVAAKTVVYQLQPDSTPSPEYLAKGQKVCEERLALAGYRLSGLLNKLLG